MILVLTYVYIYIYNIYIYINRHKYYGPWSVSHLRFMGYYGGFSVKPQLGISNANLGWMIFQYYICTSWNGRIGLLWFDTGFCNVQIYAYMQIAYVSVYITTFIYLHDSCVRVIHDQESMDYTSECPRDQVTRNLEIGHACYMCNGIHVNFTWLDHKSFNLLLNQDMC